METRHSAACGRFPGSRADASTGGSRGDAAAADAGLGDEADRAGAGLQPQHRASAICAKAAGSRTARDRDGSAGGSGAVAGRALPAAPRQRRRGAPGAGCASTGIAVSLRTVERAVRALRRELSAPRPGDGALRDAAGPAAADRLRRDARVTVGDERLQGPPVRRDAGLLAPPLRCRVPARAPVGLARGHGRRVPALRRRARRRCCSTTPGRWSTQHDVRHARGHVQRPLPRLLPATGASGRGPARRTGRGPRARTSAAWATSSATPSPGARFASLAGAGGASGRVDARDRRHARPRHHRRAAARCASSATRRPRCGRSPAGRRSCRCAS